MKENVFFGLGKRSEVVYFIRSNTGSFLGLL